MGLWTHAKESFKITVWPLFWIFVQEGVILFGMLPTLSLTSTFVARANPKGIFCCRAKCLGFYSKISRC